MSAGVNAGDLLVLPQPGGRSETYRTGRRRCALALLAEPVTGPTRAEDYPTAPVRIISGFSPGSTADITARVIGAKMGEILGQEFVIENRTGAASSIAGAMVARARRRTATCCMSRTPPT